MSEKATHSGWPDYFRPVTGKEAPIMVDSQHRFQTGLLDILNLSDPSTGKSELLAVLACSGDIIDVVPVGQENSAVTAQITQARVSKGDAFRYLLAEEVDFFTLHGMSQVADMHGLNDPVELRARIAVQAKWRQGVLELERPINQGILTVGRIDVLRAVEGSNRPSSQFGENNARISHLMLPTRPAVSIISNKGIGLAFPLISSDTIRTLGNQLTINRIGFDLLVKLQADLLAENSNDKFSQMVIPVPNRQRLIDELEADGYIIEGDYAIEGTAATPQKSGFLSNLKRVLSNMNAKRLLIPPEGTAAGYQEIIRQVLPNVASPEQISAMNQLWSLISDTRPPRRATTISQPVRPVTPPLNKSSQRPVVNQQPKPQRKPQHPVQPARTRRKEKDYSGDFAGFTPPPVKINSADWENDFAQVTQDPKKIVTTQADWAQDFKAIKPSQDFGNDFKGIEQPKADDNWADDFNV